MSAALGTSYLGLPLRTPFVLGASPWSADVDHVRRCVDAGCSAVVMPSLFAEGIPRVPPDVAARLTAPAPAPRRPGPPSAPSVTREPEEYLERIRTVAAAVDVPVIGSLHTTRLADWSAFAPLLEAAGAAAIELNVYDVVTDATQTSLEVEQRVEAIVGDVVARVRIPVAVKLSPFYTALATVAERLVSAGARGLVLFNRFYQPDIDVETLEHLPNIHLSTSAELLLRLHWAALLFGRVTASLALCGGVHTALDGVKAIVSGADAVQAVSSVLERGPEQFTVLTRGLRSWMERHGHEDLQSCRGVLSLARSISPAGFERESYRRVLQSWGQ